MQSAPGAGAVFEIHLPCVETDPTQSMRDPPPLSIRRGGETVLLAEDDDRVRAAIRTTLARHGYLVLEARNAVEALSLCDRHPGRIDVLLADVVMPGTSGPDLARAVSERRPGVELFSMSGHAGDTTARHGIVPGGAFLQKPFTPATLLGKLREVLSRSAP